jgi:hypothetical protein
LIKGSVIFAAGATLEPSNSFSTLTFSNFLTLASGSTCVMQVQHGSLPIEHVRVEKTLMQGGTLQIVNAGTVPLAPGDSFKLFNAASLIGGFSQLVPLTPGPGMIWDTSLLASNGILTVASGTLPRFTAISLQGGSLSVSGTGGQTNGTYYVLASTNVALPVYQWSRIATNQFDGGGNFTFTNAFNPSAPASFYLIQAH